MWFPSPTSHINPSTNKAFQIDQTKNNNINYNINEMGLVYQTPIKHQINIQANNETPYQFDFNFYCGNSIWSSGHNQIISHPEFPFNSANIYQQKSNWSKVNYLKSSLEKSGFKLTPASEPKNNFFPNSSSNNKINTSKNKSINNINNTFNIHNFYNNTSNINDINSDSTKKNLNEVFNNVKYQNYYVSNNNKINSAPIEINDIKQVENDENSNLKLHKDVQLQIEKKKNDELIFESPRNKSYKKIFECSGSTMGTNSSKSTNKKRRLRKNNKQIDILSKFLFEHKNWSKDEIKEISKKIGLKENKVYKWLWDQKNKEYKASTKFIVNKNGIELDENNEDDKENNNENNYDINNS